MSCEKKVITLPAGIGKFVWRNEVIIHQVGIYANGVDIVELNFNSIQFYQGVLGNAISGVQVSNAPIGFIWIPVDQSVIDVDFNTGLDTKAFCVIQFSEK